MFGCRAVCAGVSRSSPRLVLRDAEHHLRKVQSIFRLFSLKNQRNHYTTRSDSVRFAKKNAYESAVVLYNFILSHQFFGQQRFAHVIPVFLVILGRTTQGFPHLFDQQRVGVLAEQLLEQVQVDLAQTHPGFARHWMTGACID